MTDEGDHLTLAYREINTLQRVNAAEMLGDANKANQRADSHSAPSV
jgi:hypothetical protein